MQYVMTRPMPDGVPSPYRDQVHLYPTYMHGPDYSRPVFTYPYVLRPLDKLEGDGPLGPDGEVVAAGKLDRTWWLAALGAAAGAAVGAIATADMVGHARMGVNETLGGAAVGAALGAAIAAAVNVHYARVAGQAGTP